MAVRRESSSSGGSSQTNGDNLAFGLASLNVRRKEPAVRELRAGEDGVVVDVADLEKR